MYYYIYFSLKKLKYFGGPKSIMGSKHWSCSLMQMYTCRDNWLKLKEAPCLPASHISPALPLLNSILVHLALLLAFCHTQHISSQSLSPGVLLAWDTLPQILASPSGLSKNVTASERPSLITPTIPATLHSITLLYFLCGVYNNLKSLISLFIVGLSCQDDIRDISYMRTGTWSASFSVISLVPGLQSALNKHLWNKWVSK